MIPLLKNATILNKVSSSMFLQVVQIYMPTPLCTKKQLYVPKPDNKTSKLPNCPVSAFVRPYLD